MCWGWRSGFATPGSATSGCTMVSLRWAITSWRSWRRRPGRPIRRRGVSWPGEDGAVATHFHPVDLGGVILSVDSFAESPDPSEEWSYWRWGGPDWLSHVRAGLTEAMVGMELVNPDPARQASTWSSLLDIPCQAVEDGFDMPLPDGGLIRFRATGKDELPGIAAIDFRMAYKA